MRTINLDIRNDLYNHLIEELKMYANIMHDTDSGSDAENLIRIIEKYVHLDTDKDGTEYAVMQFFPKKAGELIEILAMVASTAVDSPDDHYGRLKRTRAGQE